MRKFLILLLSILLLAFITILFRPSMRLTKEEVKKEYRQPNSTFLNWKGTEIHYTEDGSGFPILMIHGFGGSNWDFYVLDSLLRNHYRVIRVDLPGFGLSDYPQDEAARQQVYETYNDYFSFLLDTLHLDSLFVVGNSLGGMFAWNLTLQHPQAVKKLVLLNSAGYEMDKVMKTANATAFTHSYVRWFLKKGIPEFLIKRGMNRVLYKTDKRPTDAQIKRMYSYWNRQGNLEQIFFLANLKKYLPSEEIKEIGCPTLILWGKQDNIVHVNYADSFHRDIKNSQLIEYDSCGHVPMIERPLDVQRDLLQFFNR